GDRRSRQSGVDDRLLSLAAGVPVLSRRLRGRDLGRVLPVPGHADAAADGNAFRTRFLPVKARRAVDFSLRYALLGAAAIVFLFPFYWMLVTSLNRPDTVFDFPPRLWPQWQFGNYVEAWNATSWPLFFTNTLVVAAGRILLVLVTSALAGYAFAAMEFPGRNLLFGAVVSMFIIPAEVTLIPNFIILKNLDWIDSYQAQIVPFGATVFGIFLMRQF